MSRHFAAEKLSDEGKALVARMYEDGETLVDILAELKAVTGEELALASLHRYCTRILQAELKRRHAIKVRAQALIDLSRENPNCTDAQITQALVYQALLENQDNLHELSLEKLLTLQTRREEGKGRMEIEQAKIELDRARLDHEKEVLTFKRDTAVAARQAVKDIEPGKLQATGGDPEKLRQVVDDALAERLGLSKASVRTQ